MCNVFGMFKQNPLKVSFIFAEVMLGFPKSFGMKYVNDCCHTDR